MLKPSHSYFLHPWKQCGDSFYSTLHMPHTTGKYGSSIPFPSSSPFPFSLGVLLSIPAIYGNYSSFFIYLLLGLDPNICCKALQSPVWRHFWPPCQKPHFWGKFWMRCKSFPSLIVTQMMHTKAKLPFSNNHMKLLLTACKTIGK